MIVLPLLLKAAAGGHKDIAELLISKGADVNAKDNYGNPSLLETVFKDYIQE